MPPKQHKKTRSQMYKDPFPHMLVNDFLSPQLYKKTFEIYNKLQFKLKQSDLFKFFQTNQLNKYSKLDFFREELDKQFWELQPMKSGNIKKQQIFYSVFASYYFNGNYLLCHDDIVQDRMYAFSYYLEDHPSGDLVLFNKTADKQVKRIKVKKNTLAIFEVSNISYHEVDFTAQDGRKAITGWFNIKGLSKKRVQKTILPFVPLLPNSKNTIQYPLPEQYFSEQYFQLMDISYQFNVKKTWQQGPFYSRRVHRIQIETPVIFVLEGYKLLSVEYLSFKEGDYILLNDPVNTVKGEDIIDIFVTNLPEGYQPDQQNSLVRIAQPNKQAEGIPQMHDSLFIIHRGKKQYYVDRCVRQFTLAHFIYVKEQQSKPKKNKKEAISAKKLNNNKNRLQNKNNRKQKKISKEKLNKNKVKNNQKKKLNKKQEKATKKVQNPKKTKKIGKNKR